MLYKYTQGYKKTRWLKQGSQFRCNIASLSLPDIESYLIKNLDFKKKNIGSYGRSADNLPQAPSASERTQSSVTKDENKLASGNNGASSAKITPNEKKKEEKKGKKDNASNLSKAKVDSNLPSLKSKLLEKEKNDSKMRPLRAITAELINREALMLRKPNHIHSYRKKNIFKNPAGVIGGRLGAYGHLAQSTKGKLYDNNNRYSFDGDTEREESKILAQTKRNRIWLGHSVLQSTEALLVDKSLRLDKFKVISTQNKIIENIKLPFEESLLSTNLNKVSKKLDEFYNTLKFQIINNRKGIRHARGLPSNGQRTKTNSQSSKIMKRKVSFVKKYLKYL